TTATTTQVAPINPSGIPANFAMSARVNPIVTSPRFSAWDGNDASVARERLVDRALIHMTPMTRAIFHANP
ncbi:MAG: hypothetical protein ACI8Z1_003785, partial [Candidatus Azotimanducaceae bacterium]